jgi:hypothetical protein
MSEEETLKIGDAAEKTRRSLIKLQASVDHRRSGA